MQPCDSLLLFVYGTLKRGEKNHPALMETKFLGETYTSPHHLLVELDSYPGMIEKSLGGFSIQGELFEIPATLLPKLDQIEGAPFLFHLQPITLEDGTKAFAYLYQQSIANAQILHHGVWTSKQI